MTASLDIPATVHALMSVIIPNYNGLRFLQTCFDALRRGVEGAVIVNGKTPHAVLLEIFTEAGAGTLIRR